MSTGTSAQRWIQDKTISTSRSVRAITSKRELTSRRLDPFTDDEHPQQVSAIFRYKGIKRHQSDWTRCHVRVPLWEKKFKSLKWGIIMPEARVDSWKRRTNENRQSAVRAQTRGYVVCASLEGIGCERSFLGMDGATSANRRSSFNYLVCAVSRLFLWVYDHL